MNGGEVDRRIAERDAADRRYNDALTAVDRALPRMPDAPVPSGAPLAPPSGLRAAGDILGALPPAPAGWRGRLAGLIWRLAAPLLERQQAFNRAMADDAERRHAEMRAAIRALDEARGAFRQQSEAHVTFESRLVQFLQQITPFIDTKVRLVEQSLEEARMAATAAQRSAVAARRDLERLSEGHTPETWGDTAPFPAPAVPPRAHGAAYVGFEDLFRGTPEEIRERQREYADFFAGASEVLDVGCGRGELLDLLRERGITARGIEANAEMADVCRSRGLDVQHADGLTYLAGLPDESLGGLVAAQVVEHLEPDYLVHFIEAAHAKLRPGATLILETINAACWVAFFESYIRDITHVRPLHPDTLKFLVVAAGFERVDVHFRSPVAEGGRLQRVDTAGLSGPLAEIAHVVNRNAERLNERLFTHLDYAVIAARGH